MVCHTRAAQVRKLGCMPARSPETQSLLGGARFNIVVACVIQLSAEYVGRWQPSSRSGAPEGRDLALLPLTWIVGNQGHASRRLNVLADPR